MMVDNDRPGEGEPDTRPSEETAAEVSPAAHEVTSDMLNATEAVSDEAQALNSQAAETLSEVSWGTAQAFDAARQHLNTMWSSMPGGSQGSLGQLQTATAALGKGAEVSYATTIERVAEFNSKAIAAWRSNAESTIEHWRSLASVTSLSDAISLNAEHARRQMEAVRAQTQELSTLATRIVRDAADPLKFSGR